MIEFRRERIQGAHCWLSIVRFGASDKPPMLLLHGTHDHALGMLPAVASLVDEYRMIGLDLRGHGHSDKPGNYTLTALIADLRAVVDGLNLSNFILVGHSLGGVVASAYSASYPDEVRALVMLDGMGPPALPQALSAEQRTAGIRQSVISALRDPGRGRTMGDLAEAEQRFAASNPGLDPDSVSLIVREGTVAVDGGGIRWRFDPTIDLIFGTYRNADIEVMLPLVSCPVLLVLGDAALAFWCSISPLVPNDPGYYNREQQRRKALFQRASLVEIPSAGHSAHYDAPAAVQSAIARFLVELASF